MQAHIVQWRLSFDIDDEISMGACKHTRRELLSHSGRPRSMKANLLGKVRHENNRSLLSAVVGRGFNAILVFNNISYFDSCGYELYSISKKRFLTIITFIP